MFSILATCLLMAFSWDRNIAALILEQDGGKFIHTEGTNFDILLGKFFS